MSRIFLSHSHEDKSFVKKLSRDLETWHHKVWLDEAEIRVGESLLLKIADAIDEVDYVIAVISDASINSGWVQRELDIAMNREIEEQEVVVLPIILTKQCLPNYLRGKLYADFIDESNYYKALLKLLETVAVPHGHPVGKSHPDSFSQPNLVQVELGSSDLTGIFSYLMRVVLDNNIQSSLEIVFFNEAANTRGDQEWVWTKEIYEGYLSACIFFLNCQNTILLYDMADANARVMAIAIMMGRHVIDVWESARRDIETFRDDARIEQYFDVDEEWRNYNVRAAPPIAETLLGWCPVRQTKGFYFGWHLFCRELFILADDSIDQGDVRNTSNFLSMAVNHALGMIFAFEKQHRALAFHFWSVVFMHIRDTLARKGEASLRMFQELLGGSWKLEQVSEMLQEFEELLEIKAQSWETWSAMTASTGQYGNVAVFAWLELRSIFTYHGLGGETGKEVLITKRSTFDS